MLKILSEKEKSLKERIPIIHTQLTEERILSQISFQKRKIIIMIERIKSERPFSVKSNNSSSQRDPKAGILSWDSASIASIHPQDRNIDQLLSNNHAIKTELHKSRKNNGILRSKIIKREMEVNNLKNDKLELINKIEKLEKDKQKDSDYIKLQEQEIKNLQEQLKGGKFWKDDEEKEQLKKSLKQVVEVKLKYESILKALVEKPEVKILILYLC